MNKFFIGLLALLPLSAISQENVEEKPFSMEGEFGLIITTGNTHTTSVKGKLNVHQELSDWSNDYFFESLYKQDDLSTDDGEITRTTAQKIFMSGQANYKLENPDYRLFVFTSFEDDRFSGFDYQSTLAAGWDHQVLNSEVNKLSYSIGPGYSFTKTNEGERNNGPILRAALDYQWQVSANSNFRQLFSTEIGSDNTKSRSETSITARINGAIALKVSLTLNHNTEVAENKENFDTETAVTLVYTFF